MNMGMDIAIYASICAHLGLPLTYPGTKIGYTILCNATDAALLARHLLWEATDKQAIKNQVTYHHEHLLSTGINFFLHPFENKNG